ncbi:MAG: hypothetical protein ABIK96_00630 [bacterium]
MPITKKSRRRSDLFESRFRDGSSVNFPLRQYLRCREDFTSGLVHLVLLAVFCLTLVGFGRTINHLFQVHGSDLHWIYRVSVLVVIAVAVLGVIRRIWMKIQNLRELRKAMAGFRSDFRNLDL